MSDLDHFNSAPADDLRSELLGLTAAPQWVEALLEHRPYDDVDALLATSDEIVLALPEAQIDAALAGHPRIGERAAGLDAESADRSAREQASMSGADSSLKAAMTRGNAAYEARFGRIYLVAAAGRSAEDLVGFLRGRLDNAPDTELDVVRGQLARITRLRLSDRLTND
ncbi:MAG: 2-oxo-4-hydroxy-4-carboxy-5-ureidoimidazoline decarboxylase [Nocardioides sp.]